MRSTHRSSSCSTRRCAAVRSRSGAGGGVVLAASLRGQARSACTAACRAWQAKQPVPRPGLRRRPLRRVPTARRSRSWPCSTTSRRYVRAHLDRRGVPRRRRVGAPVRPARRHRGQQIRARVRDEIGLPISVGAAGTKHLAKIASQVAKPDGLVVVEPEHERAFLDPLPVGLVWGIGPVTQQQAAPSAASTPSASWPRRATPSRCEHLLGRALGSKVVRSRPTTTIGRSARQRPRRFGRRPVGLRAAATPPPRCCARCSATSPTVSPAGCGRSSGPAAPSPSACASPGWQAAVTRSRTGEDAGVHHAARSPRSPRSWCTRRWPTTPSERHHLAARDLGVEPGRPAGAAAGTAGAARRCGLRPGSPTGAARWAIDHVDGRGSPPLRSVGRRLRRGDAVGALRTVPDEFRELAEHEL